MVISRHIPISKPYKILATLGLAWGKNIETYKVVPPSDVNISL